MPEAMLSPGEALIRRKNHKRVFELSRFFERRHQTCHTLIDRFDRLMVLLDPRSKRSFPRHRNAVRAFRPEVDLLHPVRFARPRWKYIRRCRDVAARVFLQMPIGWRVRTVYGSVAKPQIPGLLLIASFAFHEVDGPVRVLVRRVTLQNLRLPAVVSDRLIVVVVLVIGRVFGTIPDDLVIPIATKACIDARMPLSDLSREVTILPEHLRPERTLFRIVCAARVRSFHPHRRDTELMMSGKQRCP